MKIRFLIAAVVVLGGIGWLTYQKSQHGPMSISGTIESYQIGAGSRMGGRVAQVFVTEGDMVKAGQPLFSIEPFDLNEQLEKAAAEEAAAKAELDRLRAGYRPEEITQAEAQRDQLAANLAKLKAGPRQFEIDAAAEQVNVARAQEEYAKINRERALQLFNKGAVTQDYLDKVLREFGVAEGELAKANQNLALLKAGTRAEEIQQAEKTLAEADAVLQLRRNGFRVEDIAQAEARVKAARATQNAIKRSIDELVVKAPTECVVEAMDLRPGDIVAPNAPSISLLDLNTLRVRTYIPEGLLGMVSTGSKVPVKVDAFPGRRFIGTVTFIASQGEFTPRNIQTPEERSKQVFRVMVTFAPHEQGLRPGMICDVVLGEKAE